MKRPPLWEFSVVTCPAAEEVVLELMSNMFGTPGVSYTNRSTGTLTISVYVTPKPGQGQRLLTQLRHGLSQLQHEGEKISAGKIRFRRLPRQNWAESWKKHFKPLDICSKLLVKPPWSRRHPLPGQPVVILNPGLSFGTGQHPTTAFCLEQIVAARVPGQRQALLDIGTGSGILAIAAAKLGYQPIRAIDYDSECIRVATSNSRTNRVHPRIDFAKADVRQLAIHRNPKFAVVCANLIAPLLAETRSRLVAQLEPGGLLVLAGILKTEFLSLRKSFEDSGLKLVASRVRNEWRSGAFSKVT